MKKAYVCSNLFDVSLIKQQLENAGIDILIKNEYSVGAVGEIPPHETLPQIWVISDSQLEQAKRICVEWEQQAKAERWFCCSCGELNEGSFEVCWQCQTPKK